MPHGAQPGRERLDDESAKARVYRAHGPMMKPRINDLLWAGCAWGMAGGMVAWLPFFWATPLWVGSLSGLPKGEKKGP